jgi:hypothetical protein
MPFPGQTASVNRQLSQPGLPGHAAMRTDLQPLLAKPTGSICDAVFSPMHIEFRDSK